MKKLILTLIILAVAVAVLVQSPLVMKHHPEGGNARALDVVNDIAGVAHRAAGEHPDRHFRFTALPPAERDELLGRCAAEWERTTARFLVTTAPVRPRPAERTIIVVCDTPYTNVPQRWIGRAPPTHAAGYSDGTAELITEVEYRRLDPAAFTDLALLVGGPEKRRAP